MMQVNGQRIARRMRSRNRPRALFRAERLESRALLASIVVTTLDDSGAGSLREAIGTAGSGDTIDLSSLVGTITLESELSIEKSLTLHGPGQSLLAISGNDSVRVFGQIGGIVNVSDLTIRNGEAENGFGGGWRVESGSTSFTRVRFAANHAGQGGAIAAIAYDDDVLSLTVADSSIVDNSATSESFAAVGGGICLYALDGTESSAPSALTFTMINSVVASNTVSSPSLSLGGGIYGRANSGLDGYGGGVLNATIENSTIAANSAHVGSANGGITRGGGVYFEASGAEDNADNDGHTHLTLTNNTIAKNFTDLGSGTGAATGGAGAFFSTISISANPMDITMANNLFAANTGAEDVTALLGSSIDLVDHGHNLLGSVTNMPSFVNGQNDNAIGVDAKLGTFGDHGGSTQTIDLLYGSPAIDSGDDRYAPDEDQRRSSRVGTSDIGAYEWSNTAPIWPNQVLTTAHVATAYSRTLTATDADSGQPLIISMVHAPTFLVLRDNGDGTASITGTPTVDDLGAHQLTLRVSDGIASADITLSLLVKNSLHVLNTNDSGAGSLRDAISSAESGDAIDLTNVSGTITLASPLLITRDLAIFGSGRESLAISGDGENRIFEIGDNSSSCNVGISDLTLIDGEAAAGSGGAIYIDHECDLELTRVRITNSHAALFGGAVASANANNSMTFVDCQIDHNSAGSGGGGVMAIGNATFTGCTFSDNSVVAVQQILFDSSLSEGEGAGVYLDQGTHTFTNCTIANNSITTAVADARVAQGAGVYVKNSALSMRGTTITGNGTDVADFAAGLGFASESTQSMTIHNTLIAGNTGGMDVSWYAYGGDSLVTHTLVGRMASNELIVHGELGNLVGTLAHPVDARVGALGDYGGLTSTIRLRKGSPAINAGSDDFAYAADQRGVARVGQADIGAFEYVAPQNVAPVWSTTRIDAATTSVPYSYDLSATDSNEDDALTFALITGPAFLQLDNHWDGSATLSGTPTLDDAGTYTVRLRVSDGSTSVTFQSNLVIAAPLAELDEHTLYINGTNGDNVINAFLLDSQTIRVTRGTTVRTFALGDVSRIVLNGYGGNDSLKAQINRMPVTIRGGDGNDTIYGGSGNDDLFGDAGDDVIDTGAGRNRAYGGIGDDTLTGGNSADRLGGDDGDDVISGRGGPDVLYGGAGNDYLNTGSDRNRSYGGAGDDTLIGGNSADRISGDAGNDYLVGNRGKDYLFGGDGSDTARIDVNDLLESIEMFV